MNREIINYFSSCLIRLTTFDFHHWFEKSNQMIQIFLHQSTYLIITRAWMVTSDTCWRFLERDFGKREEGLILEDDLMHLSALGIVVLKMIVVLDLWLRRSLDSSWSSAIPKKTAKLCSHIYVWVFKLTSLKILEYKSQMDCYRCYVRCTD